MNVALSRLALQRGFGSRHEREATPRPGAIDRVLAPAIGTLLNLLDQPRLNRRAALPALGAAARQALRETDETALDAAWAQARSRLRRDGTVGAAAADALAIAAEVAARTLAVRAHDEQLAGAALLLRGELIEMATGEGKSLTSALAAAVAAAAALPVEVFTVNAYLAKRDADNFAPFFGRLGLQVDALTAEQAPPRRSAALQADVLYAVNKDYVFEHLRWRGAGSAGGRFAGRGLYFAIVDEADSILVDEARTPLIVAQESSRLDATALRSVAQFVAGLRRDADFRLDAERRRAVLLASARQRLATLRDAGLSTTAWPERLLIELAEQALAARELYRRDRDYIVVDGRVAIVDEYTGRVLADRSWERGLHQFIEIGEGLEPTPVRETVIGTTFPEFFRRYLVLAGASGTLAETAPELRAVYGSRVRCLPTHRPLRRRVEGPLLFRNAQARWAAVENAVDAALARGQAVLVGTRSVAASETIAERLHRRGVDAAVLNAREHAQEAATVALAGRAGRVTVATNMAGRGTDIVIDAGVRAAGGLLVVLTELHESARIDRQLVGRCARQGDPGQCLLLASLDDELFRQHGGWPAAALADEHAATPLPRWLGRALRAAAQRRAEGRHRAERALVLERNESLARQLGFAGSDR